MLGDINWCCCVLDYHKTPQLNLNKFNVCGSVPFFPFTLAAYTVIDCNGDSGT